MFALKYLTNTITFLTLIFIILSYKYAAYTPYCAQPITKQNIMSTENTSLENVTPDGNSNTTDKMSIVKRNIYKRPLLIVAGSFFVLLVWAVAAGQSGGQPLQSSASEITEGAGAPVDYQVDTINLALTKDIFGLNSVSENDEGEKWNRIKKLI